MNKPQTAKPLLQKVDQFSLGIDEFEEIEKKAYMIEAENDEDHHAVIKSTN